MNNVVYYSTVTATNFRTMLIYTSNGARISTFSSKRKILKPCVCIKTSEALSCKNKAGKKYKRFLKNQTTQQKQVQKLRIFFFFLFLSINIAVIVDLESGGDVALIMYIE
jgi:hypothetical protein